MLPAGGSVGRGGKGWAQRPDSGLGGGGALSCGLCSRSERGVLRPFFHAGAQARVFREACAVGGGARTTPLARTTAPELCVQLRPGVSQVVDSGFFAYFPNELTSSVLVLFSLRGGCLLRLFSLRPRA